MHKSQKVLNIHNIFLFLFLLLLPRSSACYTTKCTGQRASIERGRVEKGAGSPHKALALLGTLNRLGQRQRRPILRKCRKNSLLQQEQQGEQATVNSRCIMYPSSITINKVSSLRFSSKDSLRKIHIQSTLEKVFIDKGMQLSGLALELFRRDL